MRRGTDVFCSIDDIVVAPAAASLERAGTMLSVEAEAFVSLARELAEAPDNALQRMVELAMRGTGADSCGVSLEERDDGGVFLRWIATAGEFSRYANGTMPREFSPCGRAMDEGRPLLMRDPARYYAYISQLHAPVCNVLLVPFARGNKPVGTIWTAHHTPQGSFTDADVSFVRNLCGFTSEVLDAFDPVSRAA
jgi:GAF domain-containing protein